MGTDIRQLGLRISLDAAMIGVGGLMGIMVASSVMLGAFINFFVLAPMPVDLGDIAARAPSGKVVPFRVQKSSANGVCGGAW